MEIEEFMDGQGAEERTWAEGTMEEVIGRKICGFWRRFFAMAVDSLLVGFVGFIIGYAGFSYFSHLGFSGRVIGFCIALLYFGIGNSRWVKGQTPGKKLLGIRVVDGRGECISIGRSAVRYTVLALPFFLNNAPLGAVSYSKFVMVFFVVVIFGAGGAIIYLYIFNRRTRQSLHDLVVSTYVVKKQSVGIPSAERIWRWHLIVVQVWFVLVLAGSATMNMISYKGEIGEISALYKKIINEKDVKNASVYSMTQWGSGGTTTYLKVTAVWRGKPDDFEKSARGIAATVIEDYPKVFEKDRLVIIIVNGFDIGIASGWKSSTFAYSAQEWQEMIGD